MKLRNLPNKKILQLFGLTKEAHRSMNTETCVASILNKISDILGTELGSIMLLDDETKELYIKKSKGFNGEIQRKTRVKLGEGIAGWVALTGEPLLIKDISKDKRFKKYKSKGKKRYSTNSLLSVPMKIDNKVIGVVNVNNKKTKRPFSRDDLSLLTFVTEQASLAIKNAIIYGEAKKLADLKLDFISNVSHELKNPLHIIRDSLSIMRDGIAGAIDKKKKELLGIALKNIDRLTRLLESLLDLAKLEAGKAKIKRDYIDIRKLIEECSVFMRPPAQDKGVAIKTSVSLRYSKVWADYDKMTQVITNLINNALKFTQEGGSITINAEEKEGNKVLISVKDTGIGIKKKDISKLFNRFERIYTPGVEAKGTGLGLTICKEIIDIHGGEIWAESKYKKGTTFNILLPKDLRREKRYG
jgi:signal transduction histidine kinase